MSYCRTCDELLEDDARFCGMCGTNLVDDNFGRMTLRTHEGEEDTFLAEIPSKPR